MSPSASVGSLLSTFTNPISDSEKEDIPMTHALSTNPRGTRLARLAAGALLAAVFALGTSSAASAAETSNLSPSKHRVSCGAHTLGAEAKICGSVTFTNISAEPVMVSSVDLAGDVADFGVSGLGFSIACAPGRVIPAGEFCGLNVVFDPREAGRRTAKLLVADQTSGVAARVGLVGRGIE
jgi:hypothetical protein